jgi:hypothetical protein
MLLGLFNLFRILCYFILDLRLFLGSLIASCSRISVFKTSLYCGPCRLEAIAGGDCQERQASKTKIPGWRRGRP